MIKIPKQKHNEMMSKEFTQEELDKIIPFVDKQITGIETNLEMWKKLISMFINIPPDKITRTYVYQIMVFNGIVNEERYYKGFCNRKPICGILKHEQDIQT